MQVKFAGLIPYFIYIYIFLLLNEVISNVAGVSEHFQGRNLSYAEFFRSPLFVKFILLISMERLVAIPNDHQIGF